MNKDEGLRSKQSTRLLHSSQHRPMVCHDFRVAEGHIDSIWSAVERVQASRVSPSLFLKSCRQKNNVDHNLIFVR